MTEQNKAVFRRLVDEVLQGNGPAFFYSLATTVACRKGAETTVYPKMSEYDLTSETEL